MDALNYYDLKPKLKEMVMESYNRLSREYDLIVMEGAGSCCEMNLKQNDLVNFPMAAEVGAPCILIGDIDRGGVFAQIIGSFHLMTSKNGRLPWVFSSTNSVETRRSLRLGWTIWAWSLSRPLAPGLKPRGISCRFYGTVRAL